MRDADRSADRLASHERARDGECAVAVVGGLAVRTLDAWCLALCGTAGSEDLARPKSVLEATGCCSTDDRVACVDAADLDRLPADATSLRSWLDHARQLLAPDAGT